MVAVLVAATVLDWALAALVVAVSGFVLEGVNGTGPRIPDAVLLVAFVVGALVAPIAAWTMKARHLGRRFYVSTAIAPLAIAGVVLLAEPLFRPA